MPSRDAASAPKIRTRYGSQSHSPQLWTYGPFGYQDVFRTYSIGLTRSRMDEILDELYRTCVAIKRAVHWIASCSR